MLNQSSEDQSNPNDFQASSRSSSDFQSLEAPVFCTHLDCTRLESRVQEILDLRQLPEMDPAVQEHVSRCARCHELLQQFTQLELTLQSALKSRAPARKRTSEVFRPLHPISRQRREQATWAVQAAVVLLLCGAAAGWLVSRRSAQATLLPVSVSSDYSSANRNHLVPNGSGIRPAVHYRSLEQCYELTSELPGVRPLQSSIQVAFAWWWDYLNLDGNDTGTAPLHERGFGLNPLMEEAHRRV